MNTMVLVIVVAYLLLMLFIGWISSKKIKTNEDFMVAGRRLGPILMAGTLTATEIGGGSSLGVAEKSFTNWGLSAFWYVATMGIAYIVLAVFAPRLRRTMVKTVPEYFRRRYSSSAGLITAIIISRWWGRLVIIAVVIYRRSRLNWAFIARWGHWIRIISIDKINTNRCCK